MCGGGMHPTAIHTSTSNTGVGIPIQCWGAVVWWLCCSVVQLCCGVVWWLCRGVWWGLHGGWNRVQGLLCPVELIGTGASHVVRARMPRGFKERFGAGGERVEHQGRGMGLHECRGGGGRGVNAWCGSREIDGRGRGKH